MDYNKKYPREGRKYLKYMSQLLSLVFKNNGLYYSIEDSKQIILGTSWGKQIKDGESMILYEDPKANLEEVKHQLLEIANLITPENLLRAQEQLWKNKK